MQDDSSSTIIARHEILTITKNITEMRKRYNSLKMMNYQSERALFQEIESGKVRRDPSLALASLKQKLVDIESQPQTPEILKLKSEVEYYYGRMKTLIKQEEDAAKQKSKDQFNKNQIEKQYREDQKLS